MPLSVFPSKFIKGPGFSSKNELMHVLQAIARTDQFIKAMPAEAQEETMFFLHAEPAGYAMKQHATVHLCKW